MHRGTDVEDEESQTKPKQPGEEGQFFGESVVYPDSPSSETSDDVSDF